LEGFAIIAGFYLAGLLLKEALGIPLPGNVIGLLLFAAALFAGVVKLERVERAADFLTRHMMLFFVPVVVGTMSFFPLIGKEWPAFVGGLAGSALISLLAAGWIVKGLGKEGKRRHDGP